MRRGAYISPSEIQEILQILNIPIKDRMTQDTARLHYLTMALPLFESLKKDEQPNAHQKICEELTLRYCRDSEVIASIGQKMQQFYIILSGKVGVYGRSKKQERVHKDEQLFLVRTLSQGEWFGEASLVYTEGSLVSFVALEDVQMLAIDQKIFKNLLSQFFLVKMTFQLNFLRDIPIFWGWSEADFRVLYSSYIRRKFKNEETVYLQGDKSSYIYLVKEGAFRIFKHFDELRIRKYQDNKFKSILDEGKNTTKELKEFQQEKNLQVASIAIGEMFGEEDVLNKRVRKYSVVCESDYGELYGLSSSCFYNLILNHEKSKQYIVARLANKEKSYVKRLDNISQYVSSVKINVIQNNQDQLRLTQDYLSTVSTKPSRMLDQHLRTQSRQLTTAQSGMNGQDLIKASIRLDLPSVQLQTQTSQFFRQPSAQLASRGSMRSRGTNLEGGTLQNLDDKKTQVISRTAVNFKSAGNLTVQDNLISTQYFASTMSNAPSLMNKTPEERALLKIEFQKEQKRSEYMKRYFEKFNFNVVDKNYCDNIISKCLDPYNESSQNQMYAKGSFNNKQGQRGFRVLGIDNPRDTDGEYEKARLKVQEEFDPDYKLKNLQQE